MQVKLSKQVVMVRSLLHKMRLKWATTHRVLHKSSILVVTIVTNGRWSGYEVDTDRPPVGYIMLTYELCTEFMKDEQGNDIEDKPRWLSESIPLLPLDSELAIH